MRAHTRTHLYTCAIKDQTFVRVSFTIYLDESTIGWLDSGHRSVTAAKSFSDIKCWKGKMKNTSGSPWRLWTCTSNNFRFRCQRPSLSSAIQTESEDSGVDEPVTEWVTFTVVTFTFLISPLIVINHPSLSLSSSLPFYFHSQQETCSPNNFLAVFPLQSSSTSCRLKYR